MSSARKKAYLALLLNAAVWGAAIPIVKLALPHTTPFRWLFYRYLIAAPLALPFIIYYLIHRFRPTPKQLLTIVVLELMGTIAHLGLLYEGLRRTSALDAGLLEATAPVFVVLAGVFFLHEREEKREWVGFFIALIGALFITIEPIFNGHMSHQSTLAGNILVIGRNVLWAVYLMLVKRYYRRIPKPFATAVSFWVGIVGFGVLVWLTAPQALFADLAHPTVLFATLYMAIFGSIIGFTLYLYGQSVIEISEATVFGYLHPLFSVPLAILLLGDVLRPVTAIGIIIIFVGVYLAERRPHRV